MQSRGVFWHTVISYYVGKSYQQKFEVTGHIACAVEGENKCFYPCDFWFLFVLFYIVYHPSPNDGTLIVILSNSMNLINRHTQNATLQVPPDSIPLTNEIRHTGHSRTGLQLQWLGRKPRVCWPASLGKLVSIRFRKRLSKSKVWKWLRKKSWHHF